MGETIIAKRVRTYLTTPSTVADSEEEIQEEKPEDQGERGNTIMLRRQWSEPAVFLESQYVTQPRTTHSWPPTPSPPASPAKDTDIGEPQNRIHHAQYSNLCTQNKRLGNVTATP